MALSKKAQKIVDNLSDEPKLGDIKKLGKELKNDHALALELRSQGSHNARLLSTLIFDKKLLAESDLEALASDLITIDCDQRNQISDWLLANQLTKEKKLISLMETWQEHDSPVMRRWFWYYQARLRWTGRTPPPENSSDLLNVIAANIVNEDSEVQWAMNFCAGWIGVFEPKLRPLCIKLGRELELYKDEPVAKNCTPSYLPEFIKIEAAKRE